MNRLHSGRSILWRHEAEFSGRIGNTDRKFGEVVAQKGPAPKGEPPFARASASLLGYDVPHRALVAP